MDVLIIGSPYTVPVCVDAEAIKRDLTSNGRVVLDGIESKFDSAPMLSSSDTALETVVQHLTAFPDQAVCVVGHTDAVGRLGYKRDLSIARATSVEEALTTHGIACARLTPYGVVPLVPVISSGSDAARDRRLEHPGDGLTSISRLKRLWRRFASPFGRPSPL